MGRAVHTNYHVRLKCDFLKMATIKNAWLAERLGGQVVCELVGASGAL